LVRLERQGEYGERASGLQRSSACQLSPTLDTCRQTSAPTPLQHGFATPYKPIQASLFSPPARASSTLKGHASHKMITQREGRCCDEAMASSRGYEPRVRIVQGVCAQNKMRLKVHLLSRHIMSCLCGQTAVLQRSRLGSPPTRKVIFVCHGTCSPLAPADGHALRRKLVKHVAKKS
jgi:hypothetical protein